MEGSEFHRVSDREERFQAYSCRVELLEQSKLVRSKVRLLDFLFVVVGGYCVWCTYCVCMDFERTVVNVKQLNRLSYSLVGTVLV